MFWPKIEGRRRVDFDQGRRCVEVDKKGLTTKVGHVKARRSEGGQRRQGRRSGEDEEEDQT